MDLLQASFTAHNTLYEIEVRSTSTITWLIYKRYNHFFTLHNHLAKALPKTILPSVPSKRFIRSLAFDFVNKRKQELQEYVTSLLKIPEVARSEIMLNFMEVPDSVRPMLTRANENVEEDAVSPSANNTVVNLSFEEKRVHELVHQLKSHPNKVAAIKSFEKYFFSTRPRLPSELIIILFQGFDADGGVVQACGDFQYSQVASRAALQLLCRLLDVERNKDAPVYLDVFSRLSLKLLLQIHLHRHILADGGIRAFQLAKILSERLPTVPMERILPDAWARQEYFRWVQHKNKSMATYVPIASGSELKCPNLKDYSAKNLLNSGIAEVRKIADSDQGWRIVADEFNTAIQVVYKKIMNNDAVALRVALAIAHSSDKVFKLLMDESRRKEWDIKYHRGEYVEDLGDGMDMYHEVYKSFSSPYKFRDFSLMRGYSKEEDGGYTIVKRSVIHPKVPARKDAVRAQMLVSGFVITPYSIEDESQNVIESTLLVYVAQLDKEGILTFSPDLLGESTELFQCFHNIRVVLFDDNNTDKTIMEAPHRRNRSASEINL